MPILLENVDLQTRQHMWLQHDGAPAHRSRRVHQFLHRRFPSKSIGIRGHIEWCPRTLDLTNSDFFLWGYLKNVVYAEPPTTRENIRQQIIDNCRNIPRHILLSTVQSFERRVQLCIENNGSIFEQLR